VIIMALNLLSDVVDLRDRYKMWGVVSDRYVALAGFIAGIGCAKPELFDGFQEFVAVTRAKNRSQAWPIGVLMQQLDLDLARLVISGGGTPEENQAAIGTLFDAMGEFAQIQARGDVETYRSKHRELPG
jgi:hypothetical protein